MTGLEFLLLAALVGAVVVAILHWADIQQWWYARKTDNHNIGIMIRKELSAGRVAVCTGVFDKSGDLINSDVTSWKAEKLEYSVTSAFGGRKMARVTL